MPHQAARGHYMLYEFAASVSRLAEGKNGPRGVTSGAR
jgi:hypothetical protein